MVGTALTTFEDRPALSAKHRQFVDENKNIPDRATVPSLSFEGKSFHISMNGERYTLMKTDADGDKVAVTTLKVVVLDQNLKRGRSYYPGAYNPEKAAMPVCWSDDGTVPSPHCKTPVSPNCAGCPMSVKGSKENSEKDVAACSVHQFIAVTPAFDLGHEPLRVKLPITSIWDGQNKVNDAAGWFAFKNYTDFLRANGVDHTALLVTKIKFDSSVAYPKLLFARDKFLTDEELDVVIPVVQSDKVKQLISTSWTPNGVDGVKQGAISGPAEDKAAAAAKDVTPKEDPTAAKKAAEFEAAQKEAAEKAAKKAARVAAAQAAAEAAAAAAKAAAKAAEEDDDEGEATPPATPAKVATKPAADDDDEGEIIVPGKAAASGKAATGKGKATPAAKSAAAAPAAGGTPEGIEDLLGAWGS